MCSGVQVLNGDELIEGGGSRRALEVREERVLYAVSAHANRCASRRLLICAEARLTAERKRTGCAVYSCRLIRVLGSLFTEPHLQLRWEGARQCSIVGELKDANRWAQRPHFSGTLC